MELFGTSGIRRIVDWGLVHLALKVGIAVGSIYKNVVLGRDTRTSGSTLLHGVMSGILAAGARCSDAGVLPTPTLAFATREFSPQEGASWEQAYGVFRRMMPAMTREE